MATPLTKAEWLDECAKLAKTYEEAMTDEAKALVFVLRDDLPQTLIEKHWVDDHEAIDKQREEAADLIETQAREIERLRRDRDDLLTFAKAIQIWRSDADSYDRECDHPQRNYCEDVELMEGCADIVVRRVTARAALAGDSHEQ